MVKKKTKASVSSKIEHTEATSKDVQKASLKDYRRSISEMGADIKKFAVKLCPDNLLSVKMALMNAVRDVEMMMRERRQ